jgi:short-subunit dehydrogenase
MTLLDIYGPWALITGASEGTGSAFARELARAGINCILIARREGPLAALAEELRGMGIEVVTASVDLGADDAAAKVVAAAGDREIGLYIANAGADSNGARFFDTEVTNWDQLVTLCHHFGPAMRERGRGGMILVGSGACYGGLTGLSVYCGSKAFVLAFAEGLWGELRHHGVHVLNLVLGRTDTPAHRRLAERNGQVLGDDMARPEDVARIGLAQLPHGPIYNWGQGNDVAGYAPNSPDARRERIVMIEKMSAAYAGDNS